MRTIVFESRKSTLWKVPIAASFQKHLVSLTKSGRVCKWISCSQFYCEHCSLPSLSLSHQPLKCPLFMLLHSQWICKRLLFLLINKYSLSGYGSIISFSFVSLLDMFDMFNVHIWKAALIWSFGHHPNMFPNFEQFLRMHPDWLSHSLQSSLWKLVKIMFNRFENWGIWKYLRRNPHHCMHYILISHSIRRLNLAELFLRLITPGLAKDNLE